MIFAPFITCFDLEFMKEKDDKQENETKSIRGDASHIKPMFVASECS